MGLAEIDLGWMPRDRLALGRSNHIKFSTGKWVFDYLVFPKASNRLLVLMPSAMAKDKRYVPSFHRHSWGAIFDANVICVSDPTLYLHEELLGGWFQGAEDVFLLESVVSHVRELAGVLGVSIDRVVFAGSSLGGWAAIAAATLLPGSKAYAENPQTDLRKYLSGPVYNLNKFVFGMRLKSIFSETPYRFSLYELMVKEGFVPYTWLVQKSSDSYHFNTHFRPFVQAILSSDLPKTVFLAEEIGASIDGTGHTPLVYKEASKRIEYIFDQAGLM